MFTLLFKPLGMPPCFLSGGRRGRTCPNKRQAPPPPASTSGRPRAGFCRRGGPRAGKTFARSWAGNPEDLLNSKLEVLVVDILSYDSYEARTPK